MNHAKVMGLAVAYDMYKECAEGGLDPEWKVDKPLSYHKFHDLLSRQMLQWDPAHQSYPGDKNMRRVQQLNKTRRAVKKCQAFELNDYMSIPFPSLSSKNRRVVPIRDSVETCQISDIMLTICCDRELAEEEGPPV
jgi:hypothetical protein